jgi:hypothetical protein
VGCFIHFGLSLSFITSSTSIVLQLCEFWFSSVELLLGLVESLLSGNGFVGSSSLSLHGICGLGKLSLEFAVRTVFKVLSLLLGLLSSLSHSLECTSCLSLSFNILNLTL